MGVAQLVWLYDHPYVTGTRFSLGQTTSSFVPLFT